MSSQSSRSFTDRTLVVSGASRGIGLAIALGAARRGALPSDAFGAALLASPHAAAGAVALAAGEIAGDKMADAPDRIVAAGLADEGGVAGAVLAVALRAAARDRSVQAAG